MHVFLNFITLWKGLCPSSDPPHHFREITLYFLKKTLIFTVEIDAHQEGTKINTEVNERVLKNTGKTH